MKYGKLMDQRALAYINEQNVDLLRFQGVTDAMYNKGYNKGFATGYFGGIFVTVGLIGVILGSKHLGKMEEKMQRTNKIKEFLNGIYGHRAFEFRSNQESAEDLTQKFKEAMQKMYAASKEESDSEEEDDE